MSEREPGKLPSSDNKLATRVIAVCLTTISAAASATTIAQAQTTVSAHGVQNPKSSRGTLAPGASGSAATLEIVRRLPQRFHNLKQGMTEEQVFKTLGMPPHGGDFRGRGSGPIHAYIRDYHIGPYDMGLVWDGSILKSARLGGGPLDAEQTVPPTQQEGRPQPEGGIVVIAGKQLKIPPGGHIVYGLDGSPVGVANPPLPKPQK